MGRYFKAAFFAALPFPLLGNIPLNAIAFAGFTILGFGHPGFWLLGLGLEAAYLFTLVGNPRFRRSVDTRSEIQNLQSAETKRRILIGKLNPSARKKLEIAEGKSQRILQTLRDHEAEEYVVLSNVEALNKLIWVYIKLLFARTILETASASPSSDADLKQQIETLSREIADEKIPITVRQSKKATLEILTKRLENVARRTQSAHEIDSDLDRIDAQLDLGLENAAIKSREQAVDFNLDLDLASHLMDSNIYGDSSSEIADVDALYNLRHAASAPARTENGNETEKEKGERRIPPVRTQ